MSYLLQRRSGTFSVADLLFSHFCTSVNPFGLGLPPTRLLHSSASGCMCVLRKACGNLSVESLRSSKSVVRLFSNGQIWSGFK